MIKTGLNEFMKGLCWMALGGVLYFHWYDVEGLWGTRNAALHTQRVVVPKLAAAAIEASRACETNAFVAKDNEANAEDLRRCPKAPVIALTKK